jgi:hypothetical protein
MADAVALERGYRRWLRCYPRSFRQEHESEILAVLIDSADSDQDKPSRAECADLPLSAVLIRLRPRISRSNRSMLAAVKLMYVGAVAELIVGLTVLATMGDIRTNVVARSPRYTGAQWHTEVAGTLDPLVISACVATAFWLFMAWANGRGHRWARVGVALFFGLTTFSLLNGLLHGSAVYARTDLAAGTGLWLIQLAALALLCWNGLRRRVMIISGGHLIESAAHRA